MPKKSNTKRKVSNEALNASNKASKPKKKTKKQQNDEDLHLSVMQTFHEAIDRMERNTRKQYIPKMKEYELWCKNRYNDQEDWDLVTQDRVHKFLKDEVLDRLCKKKKKGKMSTKKFSTTWQNSTSRLYVNFGIGK
mmetsp:Transcript_13365/g.17133  ORF Transcript_13365/g.17133 Transcript_13365/m.17133 type:complete len:136 (+) Transcript_13365:27-434(+)